MYKAEYYFETCIFSADISKLKLYWQNEFHHMDQINQDTVTTITFGNSFVRRASEIFERNQQMCDYIDMQLLETHILYESDKFQRYEPGKINYL